MEQIKQEASALEEITMFGITVEQSDRVQLTKKEVEFCQKLSESINPKSLTQDEF